MHYNQRSKYERETAFVNLNDLSYHIVKKSAMNLIDDQIIILCDDEKNYTVYDYQNRRELLSTKEKIINLENQRVYSTSEKGTVVYAITQMSRIVPEDKRCIKCGEYTEKQYILVPCGHTNYCENCLDTYGRIKKSCYICNQYVNDVIRIRD
jgi:hypothetical protein